MNTRIAALILALLTALPAANAQTPVAATDPAVLAFDPPSLAFVWQKGGPFPASQSVVARNCGGYTIHSGVWANRVGQNWVSGGCQMDIGVDPLFAKLDVGVHETKILLESNGMKANLLVKITVVSTDGTLQVNRKRLHFGGFLGDVIKEQLIDLTYTGVGTTNWTASGPAWLKLTQTGGTVAATDPTTLTVGIDTATVTMAGRTSGTLKVSDGKTVHEIPVDLSLVPAGSPTIELYGLEVTQGIQNLFNDIPFVANRPTFVRGHVRSLTGDLIEKVSAQLLGSRNGANLGSLAPINPGGAISVIADPDRGKLDESFLFELPPEWRSGTVTLHLEGKSHPISYVDPAEKTTVASDTDSLTTSSGTRNPKMPVTNPPTGSQVGTGVWQEMLALTHDHPVLSLVWSPNSKKIVAKDQGNNGRVWDATTGQLDLNGGAFEGALLGWSPDSTTIAYQRVSTQTGSQPGDSDVCFSNCTDISNDPINKQRSLFPPTRHFAWSWPKLVYATTDSVTILDGVTGRKLLTVDIKDAFRVAWSSDGNKIAVAAPLDAGNDQITILDAVSGNRLATIHYARGLIQDLVWSPDGTMIGSPCKAFLNVWDAQTGNARVAGAYSSAMLDMTWSPDSSRFATDSGRLATDGGSVWSVKTQEPLFDMKGDAGVRAGQWSPDGSKIATQGRNELGIWNSENGASLHQQRFDSEIHDVGWSPDGSKIAVALKNGTVRILGAPTAPTSKPAIPEPALPAMTPRPDDGTVTLTYQAIPALPVEYYLYSEQSSITFSDGRKQTMTYTANAAHAAATSQQLLAGLPIPRVDYTIHPTTSTYFGDRNGNQHKVQEIMGEAHKKAGSPIRHSYGLFARYEPPTDPKAQPAGGPGGVAVVPGFFGFGEYYTFQPMATLNMHEIGHNLGRNHVNCGGPASPDLEFPHPNQQISDELSGPTAYYGFNIVTKKDVYPPTHKDYMSYCHPQWVSPYTYKAMFERLKTHYQKPDGAGGKSAGSPGAPILLVSGSITPAGTASISNIVDDNAGGAIPVLIPDDSKYTVRLADSSGKTLTYPVTIDTSESQTADMQHLDHSTTFTLAVPRPEKLASVVLFDENKLLAERRASANAPTLTLTTPLGGKQFAGEAIPLAWQAGDADGDKLSFNLDYSTDDGINWQSLVRNGTENSFDVDSSRLAGAKNARLRVSANDGFLTTFAVSDSFTIPDHPPVALINSKDLSAYYVGSQTILLEGTGYDLEDGVLNDSVIWYSDRNGKLGTGRTLSLNADDLAEGAHVIRLEARDSKGQSSFGDPAAGSAVSEDDSSAASDSVRFSVYLDPLSVPAELLVPSVISGEAQRIEAETGTYAGGAGTADIFKGFDGTGFAANFLAEGSGVAFDVSTDQAGAHDLVVRYSAGQHGPESTRTMSLYVNGSRTRQLSFERTGNWLNWANQTAKVQLNSGQNTIAFRFDKGDTGYINLDYLYLGADPIRVLGRKRLHTFGISGETSENHYLGMRNNGVGIPDETNPSSGNIFVLNFEQTDNGLVLRNQAGKYVTVHGKDVVLSDAPEPGSYWVIHHPLKAELHVQDGWFSLESASDPGRYLRHYTLKAFAHKPSELSASEAVHFPADASWRIVDAADMAGNSGPGSSGIVGRWLGGESVTIEFKSGNVFVVTTPDVKTQGTYKLEGSQLTMTQDGGETEVSAVEFVNSNTITLNGRLELKRIQEPKDSGLSVADLKQQGGVLRYKGVWDWAYENTSSFELDLNQRELKYTYITDVYTLPYTLVDNEKGNAVLEFNLPDGAQSQFEWTDRVAVKGKFWLKGVAKTEKPITQTTMRLVNGQADR